ncbi:MAG: glutaminase, partial [Proteus mirabilis]
MTTTLSNALLSDILQQIRPLIGQGKVADYIPALAQVPANQLAMAVYTVDGELYQAGMADKRFSIQSISKVLSLTLALTRYDESEIWQRVGKEPSGLPFNSLIQLEMEKGLPRNPFINAGAIVIT